jgi:hypothetical protein
MAVNGIAHADISHPEQVQTQASQKAQSGAAKATTTNNAANQAHAGAAHGTPAAGAAENNAGREQGNQENAANGGSKGTHVNVFA